MNPNDRFRYQILRWFYDRNANATSQYGKKGSASKISDVKKGLKAAFQLTQQQVVSNLTYLIDKGWVNKTESEKTVRVNGGTVPSKTTWFEISAAGVDKIEGDSAFKYGGKYAGINIHATGANVITLGDGNLVNAKHQGLHNELSHLERVLASSVLDESKKLDTAVDIESIKEQLTKATPDQTILGHLWNRIEQVAAIGGFADVAAKVAPLIAGLLPS